MLNLNHQVQKCLCKDTITVWTFPEYLEFGCKFLITISPDEEYTFSNAYVINEPSGVRLICGKLPPLSECDTAQN